jgi:hypothetical protein
MASRMLRLWYDPILIVGILVVAGWLERKKAFVKRDVHPERFSCQMCVTYEVTLEASCSTELTIFGIGVAAGLRWFCELSMDTDVVD